VLGAAGVAVYLALPNGFARVTLYAILTVACLLVIAFASNHRHGENRLSWGLLTAGLVGWALGDFICAVHVLGERPIPLVSVADTAYLLGECALVAAMLAIRHGGERAFHIEDVLEGLIIASGLGLAAWIFVVGSRSERPLGFDAFVEYWPVVFYTGVDGFLLALMAILLLSKRARTAPSC